MLKPIFACLDLVREESSPLQVSLAVLVGAFLAISPTVSPQAVLIFLLLCIVRINLLAVVVSYAFFSLAMIPFESALDSLGRFILVDSASLRRLCAGLYHAPIVVFTGFNNTVVMGSLVVFIAGMLPLLLFSYVGYRTLGPRIILGIQQSNTGLALRATYILRRYAEHITKKQK